MLSEQNSIEHILFFVLSNVTCIIGEAAVKYLLKGARHLYSTSLQRVFVKDGGYIRAFEDFNALQLTNSKISRIKGEVNVFILYLAVNEINAYH